MSRNRKPKHLGTLIYDLRPDPIRVRYDCRCGDQSDWFEGREQAAAAYVEHRFEMTGDRQLPGGLAQATLDQSGLTPA